MPGRKRDKKKHSPVMTAFAIVVLVVLVIMGTQIYKLKEKDAQYAQKEAYLQQQYEAETERAAEIDELAEYVHTTQYIEDVAKSKLGLAYENEIIFKESED